MVLSKILGALALLPLALASRCSPAADPYAEGDVACDANLVQLQGRDVYWQTPEGSPDKAEGFPVVILYHGMLVYAENSWHRTDDDRYEVQNKRAVVASLLDNGFAVITPDAVRDRGAWQTSLLGAMPWNPWVGTTAEELNFWDRSDDYPLVMDMLEGVLDGTFGNVSSANIHGVGFSSGGFMTSRMAFSHSGVFKSLSLMAGSYYYCWGGPPELIACPPAEPALQPLVEAHPPTLFLHGETDRTVPARSSETYYDQLLQNNIPTRRVTEDESHIWLASAAEEITAWVRQYN
jgi:poly(3-hydroxybutyrate) depolymerase